MEMDQKDQRWTAEMDHSARNEPDDLPAWQPVKDSRRDRALLRRSPERARRVLGWINWPHSAEEIEAIRTYLETGDDSVLPDVYRERT
jgi:hypothetical protein